MLVRLCNLRVFARLLIRVQTNRTKRACSLGGHPAPYETTSDTTCTDYTTAPATTTTSSSASFWLLPTICFDTPTLCGTGSFPWTVHPHSSIPPTTNVQLMMSPAAQTARLAKPQRGGLDPPYLRLRAAQAQNENIKPAETASAHPSTLTTLPTPKNALLPKDALATEILPTNPDSQEKKVVKPQPQTARMAQTTGSGGMDNPQAGGSDNGHPAWAVVVDAGSSIAVITPVASGVAKRGVVVEPRDDDDDEEESRATRTHMVSESFTGALMAVTAVLFVVLVVVGL